MKKFSPNSVPIEQFKLQTDNFLWTDRTLSHLTKLSFSEIFLQWFWFCPFAKDNHSNIFKLSLMSFADHTSIQFSSVVQSYLTLCDLMSCSTPGLPVQHQLLEPTQTHVHWVSDAIQLSYPLSSPSPPAFNLSQHLGLFKWVSSPHQVAKVLEFQLQHESFQWTPRADLL